jgi:cytochrome c
MEYRLFTWVKTLAVLLLILKLACSSVHPRALISPGGVPQEKAPEESRFSKVVLVERLDEPMELVVLSNGQVLFIELKGKLKLYDPASKTTTIVGNLEVYDQNEDGLLGMAADPDYDRNHYLYLYYSPEGPASINRLSRFVFENNRLDLSSEKIIIEIPVLRGCCHSGGSIAFGPDGNLFLSLGDDTPATKYSPIDERPTKNSQPADVQRSSANTNDLRGKILRIHIEKDGSYTIPEGNLFPKGTPGARPEIFVMGTRNPFRISVDQKTGALYWGEVGPDAGEDSVGLGPKGHDEINRAVRAGNYGWPYFVGNNKAYWDYDFDKQVSGKPFDPAAPVNNSPNNTGLQTLPPARNALIWYPYSESEEFPEVGKGGRNAMAGPVFYADMFAASEIKFPAYYNGKLFIYDWMRDWIMTVTMDAEGNYQHMERFMPGTTFSKPVDMQFAKDGSLYVLEYGTYWHAQNDDARLSRIEFSEGNRKPVAKAVMDKKAGAAPLAVQFSSKGSFDYDKGDKLHYEWSFDTGGIVQSRRKIQRLPLSGRVSTSLF